VGDGKFGVIKILPTPPILSFSFILFSSVINPLKISLPPN